MWTDSSGLHDGSAWVLHLSDESANTASPDFYGGASPLDGSRIRLEPV